MLVVVLAAQASRGGDYYLHICRRFIRVSFCSMKDTTIFTNLFQYVLNYLLTNVEMLSSLQQPVLLKLLDHQKNIFYSKNHHVAADHAFKRRRPQKGYFEAICETCFGVFYDCFTDDSCSNTGDPRINVKFHRVYTPPTDLFERSRPSPPAAKRITAKDGGSVLGFFAHHNK